MNGEPLLPDHGYPIRAMLPGIAGARSVKWLDGLTLSRTPSNAPWNAHYYRNYKEEHIQTLPLNSILFSPAADDANSVIQLRDDGSGSGSVSVQGVAYSGGENSSIQCVEVTADSGKTWTRARLLTEERNEVPEDAVGNHSWIRFVAEVPVIVDNSMITDRGDDGISGVKHNRINIKINSRATDSLGTVQSESSGRQRTYLYDGWGVASLNVTIMP
jgi:hypothetical protein